MSIEHKFYAYWCDDDDWFLVITPCGDRRKVAKAIKTAWKLSEEMSFVRQAIPRAFEMHGIELVTVVFPCADEAGDWLVPIPAKFIGGDRV